MRIITISIACRDEDADNIAGAFGESTVAQFGLYTFEAGSIREASPQEIAEVEMHGSED